MVLALALGLFLSQGLEAAAPSRSAPPSEARTLGEKSVKSLGLQTELPADIQPPVKFFDPNFEPREPFHFSPELAQALLWGAVAAIVLIGLFQVYKNYQGRSRSRNFSRQEEEIFASNVGAAARMDEAQVAADDLARQGLFAQAMHVLLLQSLNEMRRRLGVSIASSLTSREILVRMGLGPQGHTALADIIGRVEFTHFGEYEAGTDDYLACRRSFEALTGALGRGGML